MTANPEAVPLLTAEMAEAVIAIRYAHPATKAIEAVRSGAAIVIPASERVDVEKVRAVEAALRTCRDTVFLADELEAALPAKVEE